MPTRPGGSAPTGEKVEDFIDSNHLTIVNVQNTLRTYFRPGMGESNIDITVASSNISTHVSKWTIRDATDSDHRLIYFELESPAVSNVTDIRYNTKRADC